MRWNDYEGVYVKELSRPFFWRTRRCALCHSFFRLERGSRYRTAKSETVLCGKCALLYGNGWGREAALVSMWTALGGYASHGPHDALAAEYVLRASHPWSWGSNIPPEGFNDWAAGLKADARYRNESAIAARDRKAKHNVGARIAKRLVLGAGSLAGMLVAHGIVMYVAGRVGADPSSTPIGPDEPLTVKGDFESAITIPSPYATASTATAITSPLTAATIVQTPFVEGHGWRPLGNATSCEEACSPVKSYLPLGIDGQCLCYSGSLEDVGESVVEAALVGPPDRPRVVTDGWGWRKAADRETCDDTCPLFYFALKPVGPSDECLCYSGRWEDVGKGVSDAWAAGPTHLATADTSWYAPLPTTPSIVTPPRTAGLDVVFRMYQAKGPHDEKSEVLASLDENGRLIFDGRDMGAGWMEPTAGIKCHGAVAWDRAESAGDTEHSNGMPGVRIVAYSNGRRFLLTYWKDGSIMCEKMSLDSYRERP